MNLLISDRPLPGGLPAREENRYIDLTRLKIADCTGCFGCWIKTPGKCVICDDAVSVYPLLAQSERLLCVSRILYGGYGVKMKAALERAIPIQQPFIRLYQGETHHFQRNTTEKEAVIIACGRDGALSEEERALFLRLTARNARNLQWKTWRVLFPAEEDTEAAIRREVDAWPVS